MSLLEALAAASLWAFSPTSPWPLPERPKGPEEGAVPMHGTPVGPEVPWFPESLHYKVQWGIVTAGRATLSVAQLDLVEDGSVFGSAGEPRTAYRVVSTARSTGLVDTFYKVDDLNQSWIDTQTLASLGYTKRIREGGFRRDEWVRYHPPLRRFLSERTDKEGNRSYQQGAIPPAVHDVLSAMYYVRTQPLEVGRELVLDVNTRKNWPLSVRVTGRETVEVPAGRFDCWVVEPTLRAEGIFIQKGRRLTLWLSADEKRYPVKMEVEVFFGRIAARLEEVRKL